MKAEPITASGLQEGTGSNQIRRVSNHRRRVSIGGEVVEAKAAAALREVLGEESPPAPEGMISGGPVARTASYGGA